MEPDTLPVVEQGLLALSDDNHSSAVSSIAE
jgi:hypothetical protein